MLIRLHRNQLHLVTDNSHLIYFKFTLKKSFEIKILFRKKK